MPAEDDNTSYPVELTSDGGHWIICTWAMFETLLRDLGRDLPTGTLSRRFHNGLVQGFVRLATLLREKTALNRICLSGGTFHNVYLSQQVESQLSAAGFEVFAQNEVPPGDGGLSLGQALVAAHQRCAPADEQGGSPHPKTMERNFSATPANDIMRIEAACRHGASDTPQ